MFSPHTQHLHPRPERRAPRCPQEEHEEEEEGPGVRAPGQAGAPGSEASPRGTKAVVAAAAATKKPRLNKFGKDPSVATDFLPDKDRDEQEEALRNKLKKVRQGQAVREGGRCGTSSRRRDVCGGSKLQRMGCRVKGCV